MSKIVKVGLIQMNCSANRGQNLKRAVLRIENLARRGAQIVCMPELFLGEYFCQTKNKKFRDLAQPVPGTATTVLGEIAKKHKVVIIASLYERSRGGKFFNTAAVIDADGKYLGKYRKMHIPDDFKNYYGEAFYFEKGDIGIKVFKTKYAAIAPMVCWDQWFPEGARIAALKGAQILFYPTAIGFQIKDKYGVNKTELEAWQTIQRSHAIANNVFVAAVNRVGVEHKLKFWGTSFTSDPYGRIIAKAPSNREADLVVNCDLSLISQTRSDWPFLENI